MPRLQTKASRGEGQKSSRIIHSYRAQPVSNQEAWRREAAECIRNAAAWVNTSRQSLVFAPLPRPARPPLNTKTPANPCKVDNHALDYLSRPLGNNITLDWLARSHLPTRLRPPRPSRAARAVSGRLGLRARPRSLWAGARGLRLGVAAAAAAAAAAGAVRLLRSPRRGRARGCGRGRWARSPSCPWTAWARRSPSRRPWRPCAPSLRASCS